MEPLFENMEYSISPKTRSLVYRLTIRAPQEVYEMFAKTAYFKIGYVRQNQSFLILLLDFMDCPFFYTVYNWYINSEIEGSLEQAQCLYVDVQLENLDTDERDCRYAKMESRFVDDFCRTISVQIEEGFFSLAQFQQASEQVVETYGVNAASAMIDYVNWSESAILYRERFSDDLLN